MYNVLQSDEGKAGCIIGDRRCENDEETKRLSDLETFSGIFCENAAA